MTTIQWLELFGSTPVEIVATISAILGVLLIAKQNSLGWPLGILWATLSAWLAFTQWQLVSDGILYLSYIPIQLYCWILWAKHGVRSEEPFTPAWLPRKKQMLLAGSAALCIALWAISISALADWISWIPTPALLWRDSAATVLNFFAQFLQARKRMENWVGWLIVNLLCIHIYWVKQSPVYSIQYAFFLGLGIYGWVQWHKSIRNSARKERS